MDGITKAKIKRLSNKKGLLVSDNWNKTLLKSSNKRIRSCADVLINATFFLFGGSGKWSVVSNSYENDKPNTIFEKLVESIWQAGYWFASKAANVWSSLCSLRIHFEKPWSFLSESLEWYSEFDLQVNFWGYVFEIYLGWNKHVVLKRWVA